MLVVAVVVCLLWPPFRIVSLSEAREATAQNAFDPDKFARSLWDDEMPQLRATAPELTELLDALDADPAEAAKRYGKLWGLGGNTFFLFQGTGRITNVEKGALTIELEGRESGPVLRVVTDHLFGNTIRNACGLVDPSEFPNSQDLNSLSIALNQIASSEVLAALRADARVDHTLRFLGCAEVRSPASIKTLEIVPISVVLSGNTG